MNRRRPTPFDIGPVHFVGIGGIGMSGIAEIMLRVGYTVQGSDARASANTERLEKLGARIFIGQRSRQRAHLTLFSRLQPSQPQDLAGSDRRSSRIENDCAPQGLLRREATNDRALPGKGSDRRCKAQLGKSPPAGADLPGLHQPDRRNRTGRSVQDTDVFHVTQAAARMRRYLDRHIKVRRPRTDARRMDNVAGHDVSRRDCAQVQRRPLTFVSHLHVTASDLNPADGDSLTG